MRGRLHIGPASVRLTGHRGLTVLHSLTESLPPCESPVDAFVLLQVGTTRRRRPQIALEYQLITIGLTTLHVQNSPSRFREESFECQLQRVHSPTVSLMYSYRGMKSSQLIRSTCCNSIVVTGRKPSCGGDSPSLKSIFHLDS